MLPSRVSSWRLFRVNRRGFLASVVGVLSAANDSVQNRPPVVMPAIMPQPKFWFGQQVCMKWECDDELDERYGRTFYDYGVVVGMVYDDAWTYYVSWQHLESDKHLPLPEMAFEDELTLI